MNCSASHARNVSIPTINRSTPVSSYHGENAIVLLSLGRVSDATIIQERSPLDLHNRLPRHHQIHRRKQPLPPASNKRITTVRKLPRRLRRALRRKPQRLHRRQQTPNPQPSNLAHPHISQQIPQVLRTRQVARQRRVPRPPVRLLREILFVLNDKTRFAHRRESFFPRHHVGDAVAALDAEADLAVALVARVVGVGHDPFVDAEDAAWLEHAEDLRVDAFEGRGVDGGFDGVGGVEGIFGEVDFLGRAVAGQLDSLTGVETLRLKAEDEP